MKFWTARSNFLSVTNKPTLVFLFGPTAVGKTDCLLDLLSLDVEIISADSMQVYRGMDIGTAKPSVEFRQRLPHHLIDIRNPDEQFHVGDFVNEAQRLITEIIDRGRLPVISGGTAFYFLNFLFGLPKTPPTNRETAAAVHEEITAGGRQRLYAELLRVDPASASRIAVGDTYRLTRALEVYRSTGQPLSSFTTPTVPRDDFNLKIIELTRPRDELYRRINKRVEQMFTAGLADEWRTLCRNGCTADMPGMKAIGYSEFFLNDDLETVKEQIALHSRRYAKRQITFFQKIPNRNILSPGETAKMRQLIFS